jgi:hypothetical protein
VFVALRRLIAKGRRTVDATPGDGRFEGLIGCINTKIRVLSESHSPSPTATLIALAMPAFACLSAATAHLDSAQDREVTHRSGGEPEMLATAAGDVHDPAQQR